MAARDTTYREHAGRASPVGGGLSCCGGQPGGALAAHARAIYRRTYPWGRALEPAQCSAAATASRGRSAANLATRLAAIEAAQCPAGLGFVYAPEDPAPGVHYDVCTRTGASPTDDEMVRVGDFWIDRYEMGPCGGVLGDETGYGTTAAACSYAGVTPRASITWFQAAQMCANAGKRLCTNAEWQTAASGTPDPGGDGGATGCNVASRGTPAVTGSFSACVSRFGAYDMAGNVWEWVADWQGKDSSTNGLVTSATYGSDFMYDVSPADGPGTGSNFPAAAIRGGRWDDGTAAGAFALDLDDAPSAATTSLGARCCAGGR